jgi:hypothetical protein
MSQAIITLVLGHFFLICLSPDFLIFNLLLWIGSQVSFVSSYPANFANSVVAIFASARFIEFIQLFSCVTFSASL